ncbi:MAG: SpoIVB peptidase [Oscillospiraceae bacterium]|nr:SpoIVB peptidase [Oscillospiraceae bacterium]
MERFFKRTACLLGAVLIAAMSLVGYLDATLPASYYVSGDDMPIISCGINVSCEAKPRQEDSNQVVLKLFGVIPIKDASVEKSDAPLLIPGGSPVGIKLLTDGVVVVKMTEVSEGICPCKEAGLKIGDCITEANGTDVTSSAQLADIIMNSRGKSIDLTIERNGKELDVTLNAVYSETDGTYKAGLWIRDSSAGVGTLTFINPKTGAFGALGHPISDFDTGKLMPLGSGEIVDATVTGYERGLEGLPGELYGTFVSGLAMGTITKNCERGIYGNVNYTKTHTAAIPIAFKSEVETGKASILTTIEGSKPREYEIEIEKITLSTAAGTKNMVIKITDPELLKTTGGIVQGMSGSPILQNGKLVGAVTHVFVSDPTRGYGIFIENMLEEAE